MLAWYSNKQVTVPGAWNPDNENEKLFICQWVCFGMWCISFTNDLFINRNYFSLCRISVYFILFGLSISPFFDVTSLPPLPKEECKGRTIICKYKSYYLFLLTKIRL
jgi:hypothetical protein